MAARPPKRRRVETTEGDSSQSGGLQRLLHTGGVTAAGLPEILKLVKGSGGGVPSGKRSLRRANAERLSGFLSLGVTTLKGGGGGTGAWPRFFAVCN